MPVSVSNALSDPVRSALDRLALTAPYGVQLTGTWLAAYVEECLNRPQLLILLASRHPTGEPVGALALREEAVRGTRFWSLRRLIPAARGPSDFVDLLAGPGLLEEVCHEFAMWFYRHRSDWDILELDLLPGTSPAWDRFESALSLLGFRTARRPSGSFYVVDTTAPWEVLERTRYRRTFKHFRTEQNRMAREGISLSFELRRSGLTSYLPGLLDFYSRRRAEKGQLNFFASNDGARFLIRVTEDYEKRGWAQLGLLRHCEGTICAAHLGWLMNGVWYLYLVSMNPEFAGYSPGKRVVYELIRECCEAPEIHEFNFMRGEAAYKGQFATGVKPYFTLTVYNPWSGRLRATAFASRLVCLRDRLMGKAAYL